MPLLETAITVLGGAVAKKMVGDWLADAPLAAKVGEEIVDVIKGAFGSTQVSGMAEAELDRLGTEIILRVNTALGGELQRLDAGAREAVERETVEALRTTPLNLSLLIQLNFDGSRLAQHITETYQLRAAGLSSDEVHIYQRLVQEASHGIMAAAGRLKGFSVQTTAEVLDRLDLLFQYATQQLSRERLAAEEFERRYCITVERELDKMETFGIPRMDRVTARQKLSAAYITLSTARLEHDQERRHIAAIGRAMATDVRLEQDIITESTTINSALMCHRRFTIRGEAGAGKSTLLQWLAVRAATRTFPSELAHWNSVVPFFIRLRVIVGRPFPAMDEFPALIDQNFTLSVMPAQWVHTHLESGRAMVLIDGIDELPAIQRIDFFESLRRLVASYPHACYIITSRPSGLKDRHGEEWEEWEDWVAEEGFINLLIERMSQPAVEQFITRWHAALAEAKRPEDEHVDLVRTGDSLKRLLHQRPELRRLSTTPLICAMICALHRERGETLPHERITLYKECVDLLLSRRDEARRIALDDIYPSGLKDTEKLEAIQSLAYWMMENGYSTVPIKKIDRHFKKLIPQLRLSEQITGAMLREFFAGRAGLLREPVVGNLDFAHRSFQEFLAAHEALDRESFGMLISNADNDQWREVILVAAGLARAREREELLQGLIDRGDKEPDKRAYLYLLAVACLETAGRLDPEVTESILDRARRILPPRNSDEVRLAAGAGNAIIPLLHPNARYTEQDTGRCIEALGQIGTGEALTVLELYAQEAKENAILGTEFVNIWDNFDRAEYAKKVLSHFTALWIGATEGIEFLSHLRSLHIDSQAPIDTTTLKHLDCLTELGIAVVPGTDLAPLSQIDSLSYLGLIGDEIEDFSWIMNLPNLRGLGIGVASLSFITAFDSLRKTVDLKQLSGLTELVELTVSVRDLLDINPLISISHLKRLQIEAKDFLGLHTLGKLRELEKLDMMRAEVDLADIASCTGLTQLSIGAIRTKSIGGMGTTTRVRNFDLICSFPYLKQVALSIETTDEEDINLDPVGELTELEELCLWNMPIRDLSFAANLPMLTSLDITDISNYASESIGTLTQLRKLRYTPAGRDEFSFLHLENLQNLEEISCWLNRRILTPDEVAVLANLPMLRKVTLTGIRDTNLDMLYSKPGLIIKL